MCDETPLILFRASQEIGLRSLTNIQRGSVFIERNPNLCFVDTIDWARIAYSGRLDVKIKVIFPLGPLLSSSQRDGRVASSSVTAGGEMTQRLRTTKEAFANAPG